ncbi:peptidase G2 autoproteolytic cleavage domain-containing protein [Paenibacillus sp. MAH-36]|uniref:Peptidase G2 autoproteolytic cleavage domain-containing protein n=1 Tax=Paenibacillus violae TaxID=3077234 RepID=A0ABU3R9T8_9BACL|nr:peptidase G2 autoproteolytic cleavage domain-containing protein [Paenibacillus sp. PFR10]MDU0201026.1 peptidase G2 autoproteolytic cleavage domain-containing protein [Paenibacillus sp. PFR10]
MAEGSSTKSIGFASHAEGCKTVAYGSASHTEGTQTKTTVDGINAHAEGEGNTASGRASHVEGGGVDSIGRPFPNLASGNSSHAEGLGNIASGLAAHAEGVVVIASGDGSHAEGAESTASGFAGHAEGQIARAIGDASHAEGFNTTARGLASHSEGRLTTASGRSSHAEGFTTTASGIASHAEGQGTTASEVASHAEGEGTTASGEASHAEGSSTIASGVASHAEGNGTLASGPVSHAEGAGTIASGLNSHAEGILTTSSGTASHSEGIQTSTNGHIGAHIMGTTGKADSDFSWFLANGLNDDGTGNNLAAKIIGSGINNGKGFADVGWFGGGADFAEMFETMDGQPIDVGYMVTLDGDGDRIRKAKSNDHFLLGITSANPSFLANSGELRWKDKFMTDEWGRVLLQNVLVPAVVDKKGKVIIPEHMETRPRINPNYNAAQSYKARSQRLEWVAVGLLGQILVRDDGTCLPKGYCKPNDEGIATSSTVGYRVMKRTGPNQILVLVQPVQLG